MLEQMAERIARRLANFDGEDPSYLVKRMTGEILEQLDVDLAHLVAFVCLVDWSAEECGLELDDPGHRLQIRKQWRTIVHRNGAYENGNVFDDARKVLEFYFTPVDTSVETGVDIPE
jgi:hypothetical protein